MKSCEQARSTDMTIKNDIRNFRYTPFRTVRVLACAVVCLGCTSGVEPGHGVPNAANDQAADDSDTIAATEGEMPNGLIEITTPESDENLCGTTELGYDEDGMLHVDEERYNYARMNYKLMRYPELQAATGLTDVSDCAGARAFIRGYNQYKSAHPEFIEVLPRPNARPPALNPEPPSAVPSGDEEVPKIYDGTPIAAGYYDYNTMGIQAAEAYPRPLEGDSIVKGTPCSAVRLAGPFLLTSAHCVPTPNSTSDTVSFYIWIRRGTQTTAAFFKEADGTKTRFRVVSQQSPGYTGFGDYNNDLALLYVPYPQQKKLQRTSEERAAFNTEPVMISTRTPQAGDIQTLRSWGPMTLRLADPGASKWKQNTNTDPVEIDGVDASKQSWYYVVRASNGTSVCQGDSGSGAYRATAYLDGILSWAEGTGEDPFFYNCATVATSQYWTNVAQQDVRWWFDDFFWNVQSDPNSDTWYYCGFVPGIMDGGAYDPENPTAYYSCGFKVSI